MELEIIHIFTYLLLVIAIIYFFKKNDEFLMIIIFFFCATGLNRYSSILTGESEWVNVNYVISLFRFDDFLAVEALNLFLLGSFLFMFSYMFFNANVKRTLASNDSNAKFYKFLLKKKSLIIKLFVVFVIINFITKILLSGAINIALGNSYAFLFRLAIGGIILLAFLIFRKIEFKRHPYLKIGFLGMIVFSAYISYNPSLRFQFLSWMVALGMLILKDTGPVKKFKYYLAGGAALILFFSLAGVARYHDMDTLSWKEKYELALKRTTTTEDQNMLDGFIMVLQVYPHELDFQYGSEHLEILMRPIPRSLWPGKPVGGYVNKLGLNDGSYQGTVGISQSIYGTFYGEGGTWGIIIFSILYGFLFVKIFRYSTKYSSDMRFLIKGIVFASLIPLLRGGDLPGIIAFIGMSYWPVLIIIYQYNNFLKYERKAYFKDANSRVNKSVLVPFKATV